MFDVIANHSDTKRIYELISDNKQYALIGINEYGVSFTIGTYGNDYPEYSIHGNDIPAWNRKAGIE